MEFNFEQDKWFLNSNYTRDADKSQAEKYLYFKCSDLSYTHTYMFILYIYIYMHMYVCVGACVCVDGICLSYQCQRDNAAG